jgi:hypothetical protein
MKQLVPAGESPSILIADLKRGHLVGVQTPKEYGKYILSIKFGPSGLDALAPFSFSNGESVWSSAASVEELLNDALRDKRVTVLVFESLSEMANWINS